MVGQIKIQLIMAVLVAVLVVVLVNGALADDPKALVITPASPGKIIQNVRISKSAFNPSLKEELGVYYQLASDAAVAVKVYDPDHELVAAPADGVKQSRGENSVLWDGKEPGGRWAPDEAYYTTIEAVDESGYREIYDPSVFSGGEEKDLVEAKIDAVNGTIHYRLPEMARVRIRLGIAGGPLLYTLVDWKPRLAGEVTEYWNGKDKDNLIDMRTNPRFKMIITYMTLPENSAITYGNKNLDYIAYKEISNGVKKKDYAVSAGAKRERSMHYSIPRVMDRSPSVVMTFPKKKAVGKDGVPILQGKTLVHVELGEKSKPFFQEMKYEICFFLDGEFFAEEESGYSPYNWVWDTSQIKAGDYILTVNLSSFKDQIGILSRKVKVIGYR